MFAGLFCWLGGEMKTPLVTKGHKRAKIAEALITVPKLEIQ